MELPLHVLHVRFPVHSEIGKRIEQLSDHIPVRHDGNERVRARAPDAAIWEHHEPCITLLSG